MTSCNNPFINESGQPFVAIKGLRCGYLQIASSVEATQYSQLSPELLQIAKDWAIRVEGQEAKRIYWITLSEQVRHLHIHVYPRWNDEELRGLELFQQREKTPQPFWTKEMNAELIDWAEKFNVHLIDMT